MPTRTTTTTAAIAAADIDVDDYTAANNEGQQQQQHGEGSILPVPFNVNRRAQPSRVFDPRFTTFIAVPTTGRGLTDATIPSQCQPPSPLVCLTLNARSRGNASISMTAS